MDGTTHFLIWVPASLSVDGVAHWNLVPTADFSELAHFGSMAQCPLPETADDRSLAYWVAVQFGEPVVTKRSVMHWHQFQGTPCLLVRLARLEVA